MLIIILLLTSCTWAKDKRIISKIEKTYEKQKGYKCKANIRIISDNSESIYLIEETYSKPNKYKLEVISPKESKGIIILNTDDKIFVEHPSIDQSISLVTIKSINNQLLIKDFFERLSKAKYLTTEKINKVDYLVFEFKLDKKNKYRHSGKIWLKKKGYQPYRLIIYDDSEKIQVEINYENFKFSKKDLL